MQLTNKQLSEFHERSYFVIPQLYSDAQMTMLKEAANKIVNDFEPSTSKSIFSTNNADTNRDSYFLDSGDKIRCFFEEEAFDEHGELKQSKALSINKIGHALHQHVETFSDFSRTELIKNLATQLGLLKPQINQSMYIFKQPRIGGEVRWHQDATYFFTTPQSVLTFWFAIEDAHINNGCLQVATNAKAFPIKEQFVRDQNNNTCLIPLNQVQWPSEKASKPIEVKQGSLVVFKGNLPHFSHPNRSESSRHAYTLHITDAKAEYHPHNWLQTPPLVL